jgi:dTDP-4-dehydrorhamnose 3,5-epimerase
MGTVDLEKILVTPLSRIPTTGGDVLHALKFTEIGFEKFGEAYFSWISSGSIKAWKMHKSQTMNLIVPVGKVKFVFYDIESNIFKVIEIGEDNYCRLTVPKGIWFGFKGNSSGNSLILNLSSGIHDPKEIDRKIVSEVNFDW